MFPRAQQKQATVRNSILEQGRQGMAPIYGQVIASAPTWSGPFDAPPIPGPIDPGPKPRSEGSSWLGLGASILTGGLCAASASTGVGMILCPALSTVADTLVQKFVP